MLLLVCRAGNVFDLDCDPDECLGLFLSASPVSSFRRLLRSISYTVVLIDMLTAAITSAPAPAPITLSGGIIAVHLCVVLRVVFTEVELAVRCG